MVQSLLIESITLALLYYILNFCRLLRATFYIFQKQMSEAMTDLTHLISCSTTDTKLKVNALIKRASLYIQQCKDPTKDPELSFADFSLAIQLDPENADIYHHRWVYCVLSAFVIKLRLLGVLFLL
jgi:hypothetical protein